MKKIAVTGAGGFIGSHLVELLAARGYSIRAFVRYNSKNSHGWLEGIDFKNKVEVISGDIRDYDSVYRSLVGCDAVFHLAALIGIPYSYISPLAYVKTNVEGTYNILEASRQLGLKNVIITSTSEVYGTADYVPIDEKHPLSAQSPYAATKIAADQLALSYYRSFGLPVKIVRPFNTFGPRQSARAVIPTIITQVLKNKDEIKIGNLNTTRDFTYVKDTVKGFLEIALSSNLTGQVTNIGSGKEISIIDLVNLISSLAKSKIKIKTDKKRLRPKNSEVGRLLCDNSNLIANSAWRPKYTLEDGLRSTISWLKNNDCLFKAENYNV